MRLRTLSSNSGKPSKLIQFLTNRVGIITFAFLSLAFLYSALIISDRMTERAKIQENALLAGLVEENWRDTATLQQFVKELRGKIGPSRRDLRNYIAESLIEMGVEVSRQSFRPMHSNRRQNASVVFGENVYGIVRSFRATPSESILLAVPLRSSHVESIAIALAFAKYAKNQNYWARDLIFLFVDGGDKYAAEAWLSAYHGHSHHFLDSMEEGEGQLTLHGGSIIGAFALDLIGNTFSQVDIQYGMVNGKLPNMDLLNLFVLLVEKAGSTASIHGIRHQHGRNKEYEYETTVKIVIQGILDQSLNELESLTSVFGRYGVHAVTLSARPVSPNQQNQQQQSSTVVDLSDMVHVVEGGMRSLNNLLEKLHHSYLLYILTSPNRFLSVALYMPLMGLLLAPMLLLAIREWFRMGGASQLLVSVGPALVKLAYSHLLPLAFYGLLLFLFADPNFSKFQLATATIFFPLFVSFLCFFFPISGPAANLHFARFIVAIELSLFLGSLSLVHFSLALFLSVLLLPHSFSILLLPSNCAKWCRFVVFLSTHPLLVSSLLFLLSNPDFNFTFDKLWPRITKQLTRIIFAHFIHGSWLLPVLIGPFLTFCLALGQILVNIVEAEEEGTEITTEEEKKNN